VKPFARKDTDVYREGQSFIETLKEARPAGLIGLTGAGRIFTPEALTWVFCRI
jgi:hypothetical protein